MREIELIKEQLNQEKAFVDMLRVKVEALESVLKNQVPNFEEQLVKERLLAEKRLNVRISN